jgi:hypothetical protein
MGPLTVILEVWQEIMGARSLSVSAAGEGKRSPRKDEPPELDAAHNTGEGECQDAAAPRGAARRKRGRGGKQIGRKTRRGAGQGDQEDQAMHADGDVDADAADQAGQHDAARASDHVTAAQGDEAERQRGAPSTKFECRQEHNMHMDDPTGSGTAAENRGHVDSGDTEPANRRTAALGPRRQYGNRKRAEARLLDEGRHDDEEEPEAKQTTDEPALSAVAERISEQNVVPSLSASSRQISETCQSARANLMLPERGGACSSTTQNQMPEPAHVLVPETLAQDEPSYHNMREERHQGHENSSSRHHRHVAAQGTPSSSRMSSKDERGAPERIAATARDVPQASTSDDHEKEGSSSTRADLPAESLYLVDFGSAPLILPTLTMSMAMHETHNSCLEDEQEAEGQPEHNEQSGFARQMSDTDRVCEANASTMQGLLQARIQGEGGLGQRRESNSSTTTRGSVEEQPQQQPILHAAPATTWSSSTHAPPQRHGCPIKNEGAGTTSAQHRPVDIQSGTELKNNAQGNGALGKAVITPHPEIKKLQEEDVASAARTTEAGDADMRKRKRQREWDWSETAPQGVA